MNIRKRISTRQVDWAIYCVDNELSTAVEVAREFGCQPASLRASMSKRRKQIREMHSKMRHVWQNNG